MIPSVYNSKREKNYSEMKPEDKALYHSQGNQASKDAIIALRNPTKPDSAVAHKPKTITFGKLNVASSAGGKRKVSGYRYKAGKPAKGSTTAQAK